AHVRAAPDAALLNGLSHRVDDLHERDGARSHSAAFADRRACWAQALVGHAGVVNHRQTVRACGVGVPLRDREIVKIFAFFGGNDRIYFESIFGHTPKEITERITLFPHQTGDAV